MADSRSISKTAESMQLKAIFKEIERQGVISIAKSEECQAEYKLISVNISKMETALAVSIQSTDQLKDELTKLTKTVAPMIGSNAVFGEKISQIEDDLKHLAPRSATAVINPLPAPETAKWIAVSICAVLLTLLIAYGLLTPAQVREVISLPKITAMPREIFANEAVSSTTIYGRDYTRKIRARI
jgi:hypothetical protein